MLFYLTSALSRPPISLSLRTPSTITPLPMSIHLMSALSKVLVGLCACSPVEVPFTARKPARVVILTLPPHLRRFLMTRGRSILWAAPLRSEIEGPWSSWHSVVGNEGIFVHLRRFVIIGPLREWSYVGKPPTCETAKPTNGLKVIEGG